MSLCNGNASFSVGYKLNLNEMHLTKTLRKVPTSGVYIQYTQHHIITDLKPIENNKDTRICSFDIENMCTNIPKIETTDIITIILKINSGIKENSQKEITHTRNSNGTNYFQFEEKYYGLENRY
jgi:hypothetical protein